MKQFGRWPLAGLVFCLVMVGFLWQRPGFYFFDDDYGAFYFGKNFKKTDLKAVFGSEKLNDLTILPSNLSNIPKSFFSVTYRPMALLLYALECKLFNTQQSTDAWPYFVTGVGLHAICAALVFLVLSFWIFWLLAFLAAICFAFYPFMGLFIGRFSIQPFSICFILGLLSVVLFYKFLRTKNYWFLLLSVLFFAVPLFVHELIITLPIWLFLLAFYKFSLDGKSVAKSFIDSILTILPFGLILLGYLVLREHLFPIDPSKARIFDPFFLFSRPFSFVSKLKIRFYDFVTLKIDLCGLSWIGSGHAKLKSFLLVFLAFWYSGLLFRAKKKSLCLLLTAGMFIAAWPCLLIMHQARYLYLALPFFLATIAICASDLTWNSLIDRLFKLSAFAFFIIISMIGFFENRSLFCHSFYRFQLAKKAIFELANDKNFFDKTILFIGLPHEVFPFSGLEQALSIFSPENQRDRKIIYEPLLNVSCFFVNRIENRIPEQNLLKIIINDSSCELETLDRDRIWINYANPFGQVRKCSISNFSNIQLFGDVQGLKACKIALKLRDDIMGKRLVFVTWDYEKKTFIEVIN